MPHRLRFPSLRPDEGSKETGLVEVIGNKNRDLEYLSGISMCKQAILPSLNSNQTQY